MIYYNPSSPPLTKNNAFPLCTLCIASFLHVTFSRALRTAIIADRPNTKVFYDVAYPDRGRRISRGRTKRAGHKKKAIRLAGKGGHARKEKLTESDEKRRRAEGEEVSVIKLRGNPKFHFQPIYAARDNAMGARTRGLVFPQIPFSSKGLLLSAPARFLRNEMIIEWW